MKSPFFSADCNTFNGADGHIIWKVGDDRTSINDGCTVIVAEATSPHRRYLSWQVFQILLISQQIIGKTSKLTVFGSESHYLTVIAPNSDNIVLYIIYYITYNIYVCSVDKLRLMAQEEMRGSLLSASVADCPLSLILSPFHFVRPFSLQRYRGPQPCK